MKLLYSIFFLFLASCSSQSQTTSFPEINSVIDNSFRSIDKLFPIALIEITSNGSKEKIPIIYAYFAKWDSTNQFLRKGDNINCYSFRKLSNGKFIPLFTDSALAIDETNEPYLMKTKKYYDSVKAQKASIEYVLEYTDSPQWWQSDETPVSNTGKKMRFICELEMMKPTSNDCKAYIFYDEKNKIVTHIIQWD